MKKLHYFTHRYIDWVIRLGRLRFSLLGLVIVAVLALSVQVFLSLLINNSIRWRDILRSVALGLCTAPFVIYFFTLLVERLERSRVTLSNTVASLRKEVSERMLAEQKLSEALSHLEKNNRDKMTLMATISHELRTPLNGIIGLSRILLDDPLTEQQRNYLRTINLSASSLGYIFSDIIDLEKIDSQRIELNRQPTDFPTLLNDIDNFGHLMARQKNLNFHFYCDENLPQGLWLDRARLCQVLWNLISNAVKFTDSGDISLKLQNLGEDQYLFTIKDSGCGIAPEEQNAVFEMYYQGKDNQHRAAGSGIGLAISKNLAQLMQGDLEVESELGKGATFNFRFYAAPATLPETVINQPISALAVLLVEDVELNIIVAKTTLEKLGHQVDVARNGQEAISLFEQKDYDLLLLDIKLPDMSGFEIAQYLRHRYEQGIYDYLPPLIAFTANVMQSEEEYHAQGMDGVLRKPLSISELQQCLRQFFDDVDDSFTETPALQANPYINTSLIDILGKKQSLKNLQLFKEEMPHYLADLKQTYQAYLDGQKTAADVADIAHKIKGACASMGLIRLQELAELAQHSETPTWANSISIWVTTMEYHWLQDAQILQDYLEEMP